MASWHMWQVNGWWHVNCYDDDGNLTSTGLAGSSQGATYLINQCCARSSSPIEGESKHPHFHTDKYSSVRSKRTIIKSYGLKRIIKNNATPECTAADQLVLELIESGYTGFRSVSISSNEEGIQYGKEIGFR